MDMKMENVKFEDFSEKQLARAIELMISPEDLMTREVMTSILSAYGFSPEEVGEQLSENVPLHDDSHVSWNF